MHTALAQSCPPELLIEIFGYISPWIPAFYDVEEINGLWKLRSSTRPGTDGVRPRFVTTNATVAACARACKGWTFAASRVLYREICTMQLCEEGPDDDWWPNARRSGLLRRTLTSKADLANLVRTLQVGIDCDCDSGIRYDSLDALVECVSACRNLVHLHVTFGCVSEASATLSSAQLSSLSALRNIRHLSIQDSLHIESNCMFSWPDMECARQLLSLWPAVEVVSFRLGTGLRITWTCPPLRNLRDLRIGYNFSKIPLMAIRQAPSLAKASLYSPDQVELDALPHSLEHLAIVIDGDQDAAHDISHLRRLDSFTVLDSIEDDVVFDYLLRLPSTIRTITLPSRFFDASNLQRLRGVAKQLPSPCRLVIPVATTLLLAGREEVRLASIRSHVPHLRVDVKDLGSFELRWNQVPRMKPVAPVE